MMNYKKENRYNKIISLTLVLILALVMIPIDTSADDILDYDGYIVVLTDNSDSDIDDKEFKEIVKDEIYQADSLSDIKTEIPACDIKYIEPNYKINLYDEYTPNDAKYLDSRWAQDIMNVQKVWKRGYFGNNLKSTNAPTIGIIDSGIAGIGKNPIMPKHEDLNYANILPGRNLTSSYETDTDDQDGHGTFVAGIIAAQMNNEVGIVGNMPNVKLRAYRCYDDAGIGDVSTLISSIYAAIEDDVDVINISGASFAISETEERAIDTAIKKGIIICASAGNGGSFVYKYPASYDDVISVASINNQEERSNYSQKNDMVDITAPGEDILSLLNTKSDGYINYSGTSFSCPQVSALAAMCKSIDSNINQDRFMELLKSTSRDAGKEGYDTSYGWGIIDYGNMLDALVPEENSIWAGTISGVSEEAIYTGENITFDDLKIIMPDGTELSADSDYTLTYYNNRNKGTGMLTIQGVGAYTGRINKYFSINEKQEKKEEESSGGGGGYSGGSSSTEKGETEKPSVSDEPIINPIEEPIPSPIVIAKTYIKKLIAGKRSFTVKWKKRAVDGYRLQYSTTKTFKKGTRKTLTISKKKTNYIVKKLKSGKKYYIRMRNYIILDGKKQYSEWTTVRKIRIK